MPGHFIVGCGQPDSPIYIDVFNQGRFLSEDDCLALAHVSPPANRLGFRERFLRPVSKKAILHRMLLNLKHVYVRQEAWAEAYQVVDLILAVRHDLVSEIRDRGLLAYQLHRLQDAVFDLNRYLFLAPNSPDADQLKTQIEAIEVALLRLN
jgi:regulator of sirC expression with transglutaminase-like and TPR domain